MSGQRTFNNNACAASLPSVAPWPASILPAEAGKARLGAGRGPRARWRPSFSEARQRRMPRPLNVVALLSGKKLFFND